MLRNILLHENITRPTDEKFMPAEVYLELTDINDDFGSSEM
jgi:hypothetical protein